MPVKLCIVSYENHVIPIFEDNLNSLVFADVNECTTTANNICQNNGTCLNKPGGYFCQCLSNWTGPVCNLGMCRLTAI